MVSLLLFFYMSEKRIDERKFTFGRFINDLMVYFYILYMYLRHHLWLFISVCYWSSLIISHIWWFCDERRRRWWWWLRFQMDQSQREHTKICWTQKEHGMDFKKFLDSLFRSFSFVSRLFFTYLITFDIQAVFFILFQK